MRRVLLALVAVALCMGQQCGTTITITPPVNNGTIPDGTYTGTIACTMTQTAYATGSAPIVTVTTPTRSPSRTFGLNGHSLTAQGTPITIGDVREATIGNTSSTSTISSVRVDEETYREEWDTVGYVILSESVTMNFSGVGWEQMENIGNGQISYTSNDSDGTNVIDGAWGTLTTVCSGTLSR